MFDETGGGPCNVTGGRSLELRGGGIGDALGLCLFDAPGDGC